MIESWAEMIEGQCRIYGFVPEEYAMFNLLVGFVIGAVLTYYLTKKKKET